MGNIFSEKNEGKESVISLSDNCVSRITKEEQKCVHSQPDELNDADWVKKLKCMDDIHSQQNGLTYQCVMDLIKLLEEDLYDYRPLVCDRTALLTCLKRNEKCMIRCKRYVDEFIGCVDAHRINIIKEKFEMDKKNNNKEANELARQFLRD